MSETIRLRPSFAPPRHPVLRPYKIVRSSRCINCGTCIRACLYECHEKDPGDPRKMADPKDNCCRKCFACIFYCPRAALSMHPSQAFAKIGNRTYTPELILSIQEQAAEGRLPVSGAGYGGPFDGSGYDDIWTDMSEIVRPTRDGIHGREHISTTVNLGRMVRDLCGMHFDAEGYLKSDVPPTREVPIPILFGLNSFSPGGEATAAMALAASKLTTYATIRADDKPERFMEYFNHLIVRLRTADVRKYENIVTWATIVEFEPDGDAIQAIQHVREINPHVLTILMVPARKGIDNEIIRLVKDGAEIIHLYADMHGRGEDDTPLLDCLAQSHRRLVEEGLRDQITLLISGGIAAAEHVPKSLVLGADAVVIDIPLLIAMECTLCQDCANGKECPLEIGHIDRRWGATRMINLMLSWRDQLLEVLGAMGLRDVRRLRGERGRAIFASRVREEFSRRLRTPHIPPPTRPPERHTPTLNDVHPTPTPHRFAVELSAYDVKIDRALCTHCGLCAATCAYGVHRRIEGKLSIEEPHHAACIGPSCLKNSWCCVTVCPWKVIRIENHTHNLTLGDRRWTAELLRATWRQTRAGEAEGHDRQIGDSKGGFDQLVLHPGNPSSRERAPDIDLSIPLNCRATGPKITIPIPIYGGGMSFGSVSLSVMVGRAMAAQALQTFTSTGEGGYPDELAPYSDHVITQIATGLFGVREETIQRARLVEFKYAQGAKPGLGGHLLGEKNTPQVAAMREAVPGTNLFSPFPFHSVYSVEDHKKHVDWVRTIHPDVLVSVKVATPADVDMVAVGSYYAGANIIHLDGSYGGTGAAPDIAKKNIAQPIEYAIVQAHDFLASEGIRDDVVLIASGGIRTAEDALKAIALGADGVVIGTAELVAIDCVRCGNCERGRGCPIGIATTDAALAPQLDAPFVRNRIVNLYLSWAEQMRRRLSALGLKSIRQLRGRRDLLTLEDPHGA